MARNMSKIAALALIVACLSSLTLFADNAYLVGTRGEGIGFAFSALADEPFGAFYNPSATAFLRGTQFQAGFQRPASFGLSALDESPYGGIAGVNYYNEHYGSIVFNTEHLGSFSDPSGMVSSTSFDLGYARLLNEQWAVGTGLKYSFESNFEKRSVFDLDLGITWRPVVNLSVAAVGKNLLKAKLTPETPGFPEHLSRQVSLAAAYNIGVIGYSGSFLAGWQLSQAGELETKNTSLFNMGTEWWLGTASDISLGLRGGYTFGKSTVAETDQDYGSWSAGLSLNFNMSGRDLRIDYSIRSYPFDTGETLTADNFFSITYGWGGVPNYYSEKSDTKYDLSKYQQAQAWQEPVIAEAPAKETQPEVMGPPAETMPREAAPQERQLITMPQAEPEPALAEKDIQPVQPPIATEPAQPVAPMTAQEPALAENDNEPVQPPMAIEPAQPVTPMTAQEPAQITFEKLNLDMSVTQLSTGITNRIIFYLKPEGLINISAWKLYVLHSKLKHWNDDTANSQALALIDGKGLTPLNIVWDGELLQGGTIQKGKYYFVIIAQDSYGNRYMSDWDKFSIK